MICRDVSEWIEVTFEQPLVEWVERQEQRCALEECNPWVLCSNVLFCWFIWLLVKVLTFVIVTIPRLVTRTICGAILGFLLAAVINTILGLIAVVLVLGFLGVGGLAVLLALAGWLILILVIGIVLGAIFHEPLEGLFTTAWNLAFRRSVILDSPQWRPQIHFTPDKGWMNDPNGLIFFDGEYHLFFQFIPHDPAEDPSIHEREYLPFVWNVKRVHWGHAKSDDLLDWDQLDPALFPDDDLGVPFSGCAISEVVATLPRDDMGLPFDDKQTRFVLMFTHQLSFDQRQSLAFSKDRGISFELFPDNPVLDRISPIDMDFRDPKVFRFAPENAAEPFWVMALAGGKDVLFYRSSDLIQWNKLEGYRHNVYGLLEPFVECPELLQVPFRDDPNEHAWVLIFSRGAFPGTYSTAVEYVIGSFDGLFFTKSTDRRKRQIVDFGPDFYATQSWSNLPSTDGRVLIAAWMNNWQYAEYLPTNPWRGQLSVPREVSLIKSGESLRLAQWPIRELELRRDQANVFSEFNRTIPADTTLRFVREAVADISVEFDVQDATEVGLKVRVGMDQETVIAWSKKTLQLSLDRRRSGLVDFHSKFADQYFAPFPLIDNILRLRIILDRSSVEVFAGEGEVVLSALIFPDLESAAIEVFAKENEAQLNSLEVYRLRSIRD